MTILQGFVLGLVQGITEVLPVSSTAHLILAQKLLRLDTIGISFDVMMNFGSLIAIIIYFWDIWLDLIVGALNFIKIRLSVWLRARPKIKQYTPRFKSMETEYSLDTSFYTKSLQSARTVVFLALATLPALAMGYILKDWIENYARTPLVIAITLITGAVLLEIADRIGKRQLTLYTITPIKVLIIGFTQVLSLIPGFSRTGSTMTGGLLVGLNRKDSAAFAFLLGAPVILIATLATLPDFISEYSYSTASIIAFITSGIVTYITIHILYSIIQKQSFRIFVAYRIILGILLLIAVYKSIL
jgi:undecaprenyl-diphosphatase